MKTIAFIVILKAFFLFAFLVTLAAAVHLCKMLPQCWLRRLLLMRIGK